MQNRRAGCVSFRLVTRKQPSPANSRVRCAYHCPCALDYSAKVAALFSVFGVKKNVLPTRNRTCRNRISQDAVRAAYPTSLWLAISDRRTGCGRFRLVTRKQPSPANVPRQPLPAALSHQTKVLSTSIITPPVRTGRATKAARLSASTTS